MTAKLKIAKKNTPVQQPTTQLKLRFKTSVKKPTETVPEKPSPKRGPKAVKSYDSGRRLVVRFYLAQFWGSSNPFSKTSRRAIRNGEEPNWLVMDMDTGKIARGTDHDGYKDKEEASAVARTLRDKYGAYCKSEF